MTEDLAHPAPAAQGAPAASRWARFHFERDFWLVFAATFAYNCAGNLFFIFPIFIVDLGGSASVIGSVIAVFAVAALAVRPGAAIAVDRSSKLTAVWFLLLDAGACALYISVHSLGWPIYAVRLIHGAIDGTARVALFAMIYQILPLARRGEGMALFSLCGQTPAAFAPILGEVIIRHFGFSAFFAAAAALTFIGFLAMLPVSSPRAESAVSAAAPAAQPGYLELLFDRRLMPLWMTNFLFAFALAARGSFIAPFAYQEGIARVGWYFMAYSLCAVAVRLFGARLIDRVGLERTLAPSFLTLGIGIAVMAGTGHAGLLYVAAVLGGLGHGYTYPALAALVIDRTQGGAMGRSSTIFSSLSDFGSLVGPYVFGLMAAATGYAPMFVVAGMTVIAGAVYVTIAEPAVLPRRLA